LRYLEESKLYYDKLILAVNLKSALFFLKPQIFNKTLNILEENRSHEILFSTWHFCIWVKL